MFFFFFGGIRTEIINGTDQGCIRVYHIYIYTHIIIFHLHTRYDRTLSFAKKHAFACNVQNKFRVSMKNLCTISRVSGF